MTAKVASAALVLLAGCARLEGSPASTGEATAAGPVEAPGPLASSESPLALVPEPQVVLDAPPAPGGQPAVEAARAVLRRPEDDRGLAAQRDVVADHFARKIPWPLEAQAVPLPGDRRALLVYGRPRDRNPLLFALDLQGNALWRKERPLAGIRPGSSEVALTGGPMGGVSLGWFDAPTRAAALRTWDLDGRVLADFQLLGDLGRSEAFSALYWPGRGWVAAASQDGPARTQRLDEGGRLPWGGDGKALPWAGSPAAPVSIVADTADTVMFFQAGRPYDDPPGKAAPDRLFATRYDAGGTEVWARPLDLGPSPRAKPGASPPRIGAVTTERGTVRVTVAGAPPLAFEVTANGNALPARPLR